MTEEESAYQRQSFAVDDPEDFAQKQRMKQIYDARQEFQEARAEGPQLRRDNEWKLYQYQNYIHNAVQRYFFEVEGLMRRHPAGDSYLNDVWLGGVVDRSKVEDSDLENGVIKEKDDIEFDRKFEGLKSLAKKYRPMQTTGYKTGRWGKSTEDTAVLVTVPVSVSLRGYRQINKFLAEVGLDADMEGEDQDAGFDYSDILEEGPPDSGQKPEIATDGGDSE